MKVLADTRCADQVVRLSRDAVGISATGHIEMSTTFQHEWIHYFQFSGTPTGAMLSQYRRNCFTELKGALTRSFKDAFEFQKFYDMLELFKASWEAWPADWYRAERPGPCDVAAVYLDDDGLHVNLEGSQFWHKLPVGHHAVYEAHAWCASVMVSHTGSGELVPRSADQLLYTWPAWVLASLSGRDIQDLSPQDLQEVLPILLTSMCYDYRLMPNLNTGLPKSFRDICAELDRRNVTIGRLLFQFFRDYHRFWKYGVSRGDTNAYLKRIGLPALSTMVEQTALVLESALTDRQRFLESVPDKLRAGDLAIIDDVVAEIDLMRTSLSNFEIISVATELALNSPLMLKSVLVPPVCAREDSQAYVWFSVAFSGEPVHPVWGDQRDRVLLRQQLSIAEHVMMQLAFGTDLACYGPLDWRLPINQCPAAAQCMSLPGRRGIEFCVDPAWRRMIGLLIPGLFNHHDDEPREELIPGIGEVIRETQVELRGEGPQAPLTEIDYEGLNLHFSVFPRSESGY